MRGATVKIICENKKCKAEKTVRVADVKRGWGKYCCKSCKAIAQEMKTGQHRAYKNRIAHNQNYDNDDEHRTCQEIADKGF